MSDILKWVRDKKTGVFKAKCVYCDNGYGHYEIRPHEEESGDWSGYLGDDHKVFVGKFRGIVKRFEAIERRGQVESLHPDHATVVDPNGKFPDDHFPVFEILEQLFLRGFTVKERDGRTAQPEIVYDKDNPEMRPTCDPPLRLQMLSPEGTVFAEGYSFRDLCLRICFKVLL